MIRFLAVLLMVVGACGGNPAGASRLIGRSRPKGPWGKRTLCSRRWVARSWRNAFMLAILLPLATFVLESCGKDCAPIPCPCPGFDTETCQCRSGGCFPIDAGAADAGGE